MERGKKTPSYGDLIRLLNALRNDIAYYSIQNMYEDHLYAFLRSYSAREKVSYLFASFLSPKTLESKTLGQMTLAEMFWPLQRSPLRFMEESTKCILY